MASQFNPLQPPMAATYVTNALAEKVSAKGIRARPRRSIEVGKQTTARATSQMPYHGKNQGVIKSNAPSERSAARTIVRVVGTSHNQTAPIMVVMATNI